MTDQEYMRLAIEAGKKSTEKYKVGAVIVCDGEIIATTNNSQHKDSNATAHAEIKAIGVAGKHLGRKNLQGCTVYTTCEPCTMCCGGLFYAKVDRVVYGATMADIDHDNQRIMTTIESLAELKKFHPEITPNVLRNECLRELYS